MRVKAQGMNPDEGIRIIQGVIDRLRTKSYEELLGLFDVEVLREQGESGASYEIEIQSFWDSKEGENVRVIVRLDVGGGRKRRLKIVDDFIMAPDGSFVGESD